MANKAHKPHKITALVQLLPDEPCMVLNYKKRPGVWESGVVKSVKIGVGSEGDTKVTYDVLLDRKTISKEEKRKAKRIPNYEPWTRPVWLTVSDDKIQHA